MAKTESRMKYLECYAGLKKALLLNKAKIDFDSIRIQKYSFDSLSNDLLPGKTRYHCRSHHIDFEDPDTYYNHIGYLQENVHIKDVRVEENRRFPYYFIRSREGKPARKLTFLFHGFNEKSWNKYLPWARAICDRTNSAVVLFPIAFHMHRAPLLWSDKRITFQLSAKRKERFHHIIESTLSNVAISMRLHAMPQRFIWSGLQTYYDVIQFIEDGKQGRHELVDREFKFDIFAYSIGGLLAQILKLANHKGYFGEAKICLFCSGVVFTRLSPVSRFMLDSEASVALYSYLVEHFDSFLKKDTLLHHYMEGDHFEGKVFH
jgi:hypothetical protein